MLVLARERGPRVGALTDRREAGDPADPRSVEVVAQIAKIVLAIVPCVHRGARLARPIRVLLIANILNGFGVGAGRGRVPRLTRHERAQGTSGRRDRDLQPASCSIAAIIGALAGGIVVATVGTPIVFGINALTYIPL